jgi:hypothetical protein
MNERIRELAKESDLVEGDTQQDAINRYLNRI